MKASILTLTAAIAFTAGCDTNEAVETVYAAEPGLAATEKPVLQKTCVNSVALYAGVSEDGIYAGNTSSLGSGASTYVFQNSGNMQWICKTNTVGKVVLIKGPQAGES